MVRHIGKFAALFATALVGGAMVSCSSRIDEDALKEGKARVALGISTDAGFSTRALNEGSWQNVGNYNIEIVSASGEVVGAYKANALPASIELESGSYTAHAFYGEEHVASRNEFLSEGKTDFVVNTNDEKQVKIACAPTCGKVKVVFGAQMATYFSDYYVTFSTPKMDAGTEVTWAKGDSEPWYLAVSETGDVVTATVHLTLNEQYAADLSKAGEDWSKGTVTRTYTLQRNRAWTLGIDPDYTATNGQVGISITIDDGTNDHDVDVVIPAEWI